MTEASTQQPRAWVVLAAAGSGSRFGDSLPKQFVSIGGTTLLDRSLASLQQCPQVCGLVLVLPPDRVQDLETSYKDRFDLPIVATAGGRRRVDSVRAGIERLPVDCNLVLVHDGARPNLTPELIGRVATEAWRNGACVPSLPMTDTVKQVNECGRVVTTLDRTRLRLVQTPQGFRREVLEKAYQWAERKGALEDFTDDAALVEASGGEVTTVAGDPDNIKITLAADVSRLQLATPRVGHGYDVHRLVPNRKLFLCGVEIEHSSGLLGHSDGDAALHALCDAVLGASGLGDIGRHFPDTDPQYQGAGSLELLKKVVELAARAGWQVSSADITIVAEEPRLSKQLALMAQTVADVLGVPAQAVGVKATTEEGLGFTGSHQGIASHALAVLVPAPDHR